MKIPRWKKMLSYVRDVHLESHSSDINPSLHLALVKGRLQLCTDNSIYSFEDKYDNFYKTFQKINQKNWDYESVLILGFGLGSIPTMIEKKLNFKLHYTGIEIDDIIIDLVSEYVLPQLKSSVELIHSKAEVFVNSSTSCYDMICVDVFIDDVIPQQILAKSFMHKLKTRLNPKGVILLNMLADYKSDKENAEKYFKKVLQKVFTQSMLYNTGTNYILISNKAAIN